MKCCDLIRLLDDIADPSLASDWDNPGLLVGNPGSEIKKVLLCVDATDEVIDEACEYRVDMIISHHPLIFGGIKKVNSDDFVGRRIIRLIQNDMACFAMHTNFDVSCMGDEAAEKIGLKDSEVLQLTDEAAGFGRVGYLEDDISVYKLCDMIKERFDLETVKVFGDLQASVRKVAIMPGSGSSSIKDAVKSGAQVLITGDIGHHDGIDAVAKDLIIIDAGHFGIEKIFVDYMKDYLERNARELEVFTDTVEDPFTVV